MDWTRQTWRQMDHTDSDHCMLYFFKRNACVKDTGDVCTEDCSRSGLFQNRGKKRLIPSPRSIDHAAKR
eukprot:scaffold2917_cov50-Cylindrotheca_fusiformis.AAC.1